MFTLPRTHLGPLFESLFRNTFPVILSFMNYDDATRQLISSTIIQLSGFLTQPCPQSSSQNLHLIQTMSVPFPRAVTKFPSGRVAMEMLLPPEMAE